jgi:hypothetical protein
MPLPQRGPHGSNIKQFCVTLCRHRGAPRIVRIAAAQRLSLIRHPDAPKWGEKSGLGSRMSGSST